MKLYDITRTLQEAPIYPGSTPVEIRRLSDMEAGGAYNLSMIQADSHMGTHADAFSHYLAESEMSIDKMPLDSYCGNCRVLSVPQKSLIRPEDLRGRIGGVERLALRGGGEAYLCTEAAQYLAACKTRLVITDALSVGPPDNEEAIHRCLFQAGIAVIENAVFDSVPDGDFLLFAFPMKIGGCDGAPVRAVLMRA